MYSDGGVYRKRIYGDWEPWFAWHPVKIHDRRVWMRTVYRRSVQSFVDTEEWQSYQYGTIFDIVKQ